MHTGLSHSSSRINFVICLGFTLIVDPMLQRAVVVALIVDALAIGFVVGAGQFAGVGRFRAFVLRIVAYACDLALGLVGRDIMMIGFYAHALFYLGRGAMALRADVRAARSTP